MIYFKKITLPSYTLNEVEASLRKMSLKRTSPLDMVSSSINIGTDKYFLGYEGKNGLTFTRIQVFIEKFLPKLIIKLPQNTDECYYKIRFSAVSMMVFFMFTLPWLLSLIITVTGRNTFENFIIVTIFYGIYWSLLLIELKLTKSRVFKAINNYTVAAT